MCDIVLWTDHEQDDQGNIGLSRSFRSLRQCTVIINYRSPVRELAFLDKKVWRHSLLKSVIRIH